MMTFNTSEVVSSQNVWLGDDSMAEAIKMESIVIKLETKDKMNRIQITDVLHVPKLQANLLLESKFLSKGLKV